MDGQILASNQEVFKILKVWSAEVGKWFFNFKWGWCKFCTDVSFPSKWTFHSLTSRLTLLWFGRMTRTLWARIVFQLVKFSLELIRKFQASIRNSDEYRFRVNEMIELIKNWPFVEIEFICDIYIKHSITIISPTQVPALISLPF